MARRLIAKLARIRIVRELPHGADIVSDISKRLPEFKAEVIFDVGANVGQSAIRFAKSFPNVRLFCFEPVPATFAHLQQNVAGLPSVQCFQLALGAETAIGKMLTPDASVLSSLVPIGQNPPFADASIESVQITRLDEFCLTQKVERIGFLKIDTEGFDLNVLKGADQMLSSQSIDLVEVEAGMNPANKRHVPLEILKQFLEQRRYFAFGIYEQVYEWPTNEPHLRRTNVVFISRRTIACNT